MFKLTVLTPKQVLYEDNVNSAFFPGDQGEFEILPFHKSLISLLERGKIIINWEKAIKISKGILRMENNEATALVEE